MKYDFFFFYKNNITIENHLFEIVSNWKHRLPKPTAPCRDFLFHSEENSVTIGGLILPPKESGEREREKSYLWENKSPTKSVKISQQNVINPSMKPHMSDPHPTTLNSAQGKGRCLPPPRLAPHFDSNSPVIQKGTSKRQSQKIDLQLFHFPPLKYHRFSSRTCSRWHGIHLPLRISWARAECSLINCSGISPFTVCILPARGSLWAAARALSRTPSFPTSLHTHTHTRALSEQQETNVPVQPGSE